MTDALEAPTQRKQHSRSVSQLNDFQHCSWSFYLKRIKHVPEAPSVWLAGGKAFHTATELFDRASWQETDLTQFDPADFEQAFTDAFNAEIDLLREQHPDVPVEKYRAAGRVSKEKPNKEDHQWWSQAGRGFTRAYIEWRTSTADSLRIAPVKGGPGIEVEVTAPLSGVPMRGYVDRLMQDTRTGDLLVVDMKSGSREPASPMQLATYAVQLERLVGQRPLWGAYYMARKGDLGDPISLAQFTPDRLGGLYRALDRSVAQRNFIPKIDTQCVSCGVRSACIWQGGTEPS